MQHANATEYIERIFSPSAELNFWFTFAANCFRNDGVYSVYLLDLKLPRCSS
jgi:hypothetical protein